MINITDANDNHPVFVIPPGGFEAMISEDAQVGTSVFTVEAVDLDQSFQTITYSILTGTNETVPFTIADPNVSFGGIDFDYQVHCCIKIDILVLF